MLPLATTTWDEKEYKALQDVINSGMFSMGEKVREFELSFAKYVGSNYAVMVNSGSSANLLAVAALFYCRQNALKPGDEVIVPAVSWSTTYYPLHQYGLKLKFIDVDRDDFFQIHSYISYLQTKGRVILGGLLYPVTCNQTESDISPSPLFGDDYSTTHFLVDGPDVTRQLISTTRLFENISNHMAQK